MTITNDPPPSSSKPTSLARMILDDVLTTLNVNRVKALRYLITLLGSKTTRWLADLLSRWDRQVARSSFVETARDALQLFSSNNAKHRTLRSMEVDKRLRDEHFKVYWNVESCVE